MHFVADASASSGALRSGMAASIELARQTLQRLANDSSDFTALAGSAHEN